MGGNGWGGGGGGCRLLKYYAIYFKPSTVSTVYIDG